jgi:hypothetical protein
MILIQVNVICFLSTIRERERERKEFGFKNQRRVDVAKHSSAGESENDVSSLSTSSTKNDADDFHLKTVSEKSKNGESDAGAN